MHILNPFHIITNHPKMVLTLPIRHLDKRGCSRTQTLNFTTYINITSYKREGWNRIAYNENDDPSLIFSQLLQSSYSPFLSWILSSSLSLKMKNTKWKGEGFIPFKKSDFWYLQNSPSKFQLLSQKALNDNLTNGVVKYREMKLEALHSP